MRYRGMLCALLMILVAGSALAVDPAILRTPPDGEPGLFITDPATGRVVTVTSSNPLPVTAGAVTATPTIVTPVSLSTLPAMTATPTVYTPTYDAQGSVQSPTRFAGTVSTGTVKLLSEMASFTVPCVIRLQFNAVVYEDIATTTVSTVAAGQRLAAYDTIWIKPDSATFDQGYVASTTAAASYSGLIYQLVP